MWKVLINDRSEYCNGEAYVGEYKDEFGEHPVCRPCPLCKGAGERGCLYCFYFRLLIKISDTRIQNRNLASYIYNQVRPYLSFCVYETTKRYLDNECSLLSLKDGGFKITTVKEVNY